MSFYKESDIKIDIIGQKRFWFIISFVLTLIGVIAIAMGGIKPGIDFTGGTFIQAKFEKPVTVSDIRQAIEEQKLGPIMVQTVGAPVGSTTDEKSVFIRTKGLTPEEETKLKSALEAKFGKFAIQRKEFVGPTIGKELLTNGLTALVIVLGMIIIYISFRFQFDYAICALVSLIHDLLLTIGFFAILGLTVGTEVDSLFITAVLTVMGFSNHDTIVIFDRIRENLYKAEKRTSIAEVTNYSLNQTMARSINTSLTVILTLVALVLFGGVTIRNFTLALLVGIASGTYSSIFVAAPLLVVMRERSQAARRREREAAA